MNVTSFGKGLCRFNEVKDIETKSWYLTWHVDLMTGVLVRDIQRKATQTDGGRAKMEAETGVRLPEATRVLEGSMAPLIPGFGTSGHQSRERTNFCYFKPLKCVVICYSCHQKRIHSGNDRARVQTRESFTGSQVPVFICTVG